MKINYIELNNIGPYIGKNTFDLRTDSQNNIILIGGKNGAGKTTLLNSIKIALFGCYALGLKTESSTYYAYLTSLFNEKKMKEDNGCFKLEIEFEYIENYQQAIYRIVRSWNKNDNFKECVIVYKNNQKLENDKYEIFIEEFRSLFPPSLLDGLLFDGEEVAKYFADEKIGEYLSEVFTNLLNIDLLDNLETDLISYLSNLDKKSSKTSESVIYYNKKSEVNNILKEVNLKIQQVEKMEKQISDNELALSRLETTLKNYGGLNDSEENIIIEKINTLENERIKANQQIKQFFETLYPLLLNYFLINKIDEQINLEKPVYFLEQIRGIKDYLGDKFDKESSTIINYFEGETNVLTKMHENIDILDKALREIHSLLSAVDINYFIDLQRVYTDNLIEIQNLKNLLFKNESTKELGIIFEEKESLNQQNTLLFDEKDRLEFLLTENKNLYNKEKDILDQLEFKMNEQVKEENSINIVQRILKVNEKFKKHLLMNKINEVEELATKLFISTNRKENYINGIEIDRQTFKLKIKTPDNYYKNANKLSAGEKQLLLASILISIIKLTELNALMVFDTPLARLDKEHSYSFVKNIISNAGQQVLVLSTDDEIVGDLYELLQPQISREFTLDYNEKENRTYIKNGYFS